MMDHLFAFIFAYGADFAVLLFYFIFNQLKLSFLFNDFRGVDSMVILYFL